jgi:hypothetical protein
MNLTSRARRAEVQLEPERGVALHAIDLCAPAGFVCATPLVGISSSFNIAQSLSRAGLS